LYLTKHNVLNETVSIQFASTHESWNIFRMSEFFAVHSIIQNTWR